MKHRITPICPPPAHEAHQGEGLAAHAKVAGLGEGTTSYLRLRAWLASRPGRVNSSRTAFSLAFSFFLLTTIATAAISSPSTATAPVIQTRSITCSIDDSFNSILLWIGCSVIALEIFHWVLDPLRYWLAASLLDWLDRRDAAREERKS